VQPQDAADQLTVGTHELVVLHILFVPMQHVSV